MESEFYPRTIVFALQHEHIYILSITRSKPLVVFWCVLGKDPLFPNIISVLPPILWMGSCIYHIYIVQQAIIDIISKKNNGHSDGNSLLGFEALWHSTKDPNFPV